MEQAVRIDLAGCESTTAVVVLVKRSLPIRLVRAVTALGLWVVAAVCIFIPILHFFLVPGFVIAGVVLAVLRLREDVSLVALRGACPRCRNERTYSTSGRYREGRSVHCDGCGNAFTLHTPAQLAASSMSMAPARASPID